MLSQGNEEYGEEYGFLWTDSSKGNRKRGEKETGDFGNIPKCESHKVQAYKDQGNGDEMMWIIGTATRSSANTVTVQIEVCSFPFKSSFILSEGVR